MPAAQLRLDPLLDDGEVQLLEAHHLALGERLGRELDEWEPAPDRQCLGQQLSADLGRCVARVGDKLVERVEVELVRLDPKPVRRSVGDEPVCAEEPAKSRSLILQRRSRRGGRVGAPQLLDEHVERNRLVGPQQQQSEECPPTLPSEWQGPPLLPDLQRPEDPELHRPT